ncbi:hypothetical protein HORIV_62790 [Vreelandella olivaria]|uniref:Uncharacterized protein n=1 Tax=Vreelandella olivaria TaxID=390919 RepID=A0ABN5X3Q8_9GAMM|nr:hypothetical protein HORIV_62790 [Halomonas olivaria]
MSEVAIYFKATAKLASIVNSSFINYKAEKALIEMAKVKGILMRSVIVTAKCLGFRFS